LSFVSVRSERGIMFERGWIGTTGSEDLARVV
jgi:hypothetical protein